VSVPCSTFSAGCFFHGVFRLLGPSNTHITIYGSAPSSTWTGVVVLHCCYFVCFSAPTIQNAKTSPILLFCLFSLWHHHHTQQSSCSSCDFTVRFPASRGGIPPLSERVCFFGCCLVDRERLPPSYTSYTIQNFQSGTF
jgi:hypothetical protein